MIKKGYILSLLFLLLGIFNPVHSVKFDLTRCDWNDIAIIGTGIAACTCCIGNAVYNFAKYIDLTKSKNRSWFSSILNTTPSSTNQNTNNSQSTIDSQGIDIQFDNIIHKKAKPYLYNGYFLTGIAIITGVTTYLWAQHKRIIKLK